MNILNLLLSLLNGGKGTKQLLKLIPYRKKNRGWTLISIFGLGTIFGMMAGRNQNFRKLIQTYVQGIQNQNVKQPLLNLANVEIADEISPNVSKKKEKQDSK